MRKITRSSVTGRIVAAKEALLHPETTTTETVGEPPVREHMILAPVTADRIREACRHGNGRDVYITPYGCVTMTPSGEWIQVAHWRRWKSAAPVDQPRPDYGDRG